MLPGADHAGATVENYQAIEKRDESPLTRFVNELLGLDELDALIDGLTVAKDIRNLRHLVPEVEVAEERLKALAKEIEAYVAEEKRLAGEIEDARREIRTLLGDLGPPEDLDLDDEQTLRKWLRSQDEERELVERIAVRQELAALQTRWEPISTASAAQSTEAAEAAEQRARTQADSWQKTHGAELEAIIESLRGELPALPGIVGASNPAEVLDTALEEVRREIASAEASLQSDAERRARIESSRKPQAPPEQG